MSPIRIVLAERQEIVRRGIQVVLAGDRRLLVVGETGSLDQVEPAVRLLRPDSLVIGSSLACSGVTRVLKQMPGQRHLLALVLVTTMPDDDMDVPTGFVARRVAEDVSAVDLIRAVVGACSSLPERRASVERTGGLPRAEIPAGPSHLTPRELEVLECLARGASNAEIARALTLAVGTVKVHLARIMAKTGARSRVDLVIWAFRSGLVR